LVSRGDLLSLVVSRGAVCRSRKLRGLILKRWEVEWTGKLYNNRYDI